MKLKNINLNLPFYGIIVLMFFSSCNNGDYLQEFRNFNEFNKIENPRLTGWFPIELIKSDAQNIKNISYLSTKCVFGVFDYDNEELYNSIFNEENHIGVDLQVISMEGWQRNYLFSDTGQLWVDPSPNIRSLTAELMYPGVCLLEGRDDRLG